MLRGGYPNLFQTLQANMHTLKSAHQHIFNSLLAETLGGLGVTVARRARAAEHLGSIASRPRIAESTHTTGLEAAGVLRSAHTLTEGLRLRPGGKDGHIHVPGWSAPLSPDTVILVLATRVGMHQQREVGAMIHEPRHNGAVVVHGNEHTCDTNIKYSMIY